MAGILETMGANEMTELLTAAQMRAIEAAAITSGAVTGLELMERAGQGVVDAILAEWPEMGRSRGPAPAPPEYLKLDDKQAPLRAVVLCGPGNNGGDGFVIARLLHGLGWAVQVYLYGDAAKLPPDARVNYDRWCAVGEVSAREWEDDFAYYGASLIIDAVFGTGLSRPMSLGARFWECFNVLYDPGMAGDTKVVAVDIPSGVCADSGRAIGASVFAHLTVTFHRAKLGHFLDVGPYLAGKLVVADIGLPGIGDFGNRLDASDVVRATNSMLFWGLSKQSHSLRRGFQHKFSHGHALVLSGSVGKGGAARLAARGALRIGAGVVTVGCPPSALMENAMRLDAVMLRKVKDAEALAEVLADARINALCLGPGLGLGAREAGLVAAALAADRPVVLDADALTLVAQSESLFAALHNKSVLTPHAGEFGRLFPDIAAKLAAPAVAGPAYAKVDAVREAAARAGCVVLYKGADTVIAGPDGACAVNAAVYDDAAPWLATAGAGDVLAGFITGLMARGHGPMQAAETGAWLHAACARQFGPGLIAEDLPEQLPAVFRALGVT